MAVLQLLIQYSSNFHSSQFVYFKNALGTITARILVSGKLIHVPLESECCRWVRVMVVVYCFVKALQLVGRLNDEAVGEDFSASRTVLAVSHPDKAAIAGADEHLKPLYRSTQMEPEAECGVQRFSSLLLGRLASWRAKNCTQLRNRKACYEFWCFSAL